MNCFGCFQVRLEGRFKVLLFLAKSGPLVWKPLPLHSDIWVFRIPAAYCRRRFFNISFSFVPIIRFPFFAVCLYFGMFFFSIKLTLNLSVCSSVVCLLLMVNFRVSPQLLPEVPRVWKPAVQYPQCAHPNDDYFPFLQDLWLQEKVGWQCRDSLVSNLRSYPPSIFRPPDRRLVRISLSLPHIDSPFGKVNL